MTSLLECIKREGKDDLELAEHVLIESSFICHMLIQKAANEIYAELAGLVLFFVISKRGQITKNFSIEMRKKLEITPKIRHVNNRGAWGA